MVDTKLNTYFEKQSKFLTKTAQFLDKREGLKDYNRICFQKDGCEKYIYQFDSRNYVRNSRRRHSNCMKRQGFLLTSTKILAKLTLVSKFPVVFLFWLTHILSFYRCFLEKEGRSQAGSFQKSNVQRNEPVYSIFILLQEMKHKNLE